MLGLIGLDGVEEGGVVSRLAGGDLAALDDREEQALRAERLRLARGRSRRTRGAVRRFGLAGRQK